MRAGEFIIEQESHRRERFERTPSATGKLVIFDIDDTLVNTDTKINVVRDGKIIKRLNSHDFTHYHLQPGEEFDFGAFRDAREFYTQARPIPGMIRQLKRDIETGNKVIMLTARSDFNDRDVFLDTFRQYGIDMSQVHVYRAGNLAVKAATEEKKKIILKHLLGKHAYEKVIMYDDSVPNLNAFLSLSQEYPWSRFYAWHVDPAGQASEYHRTNIRLNELGDAPADYQPNRKRSRSLFHATVDNHWVDVFFDRSELNGTLHITFAVNSGYEPPDRPTAASKSTARILSTVLNIIKEKLPEYVKRARPPAISFTARGDNRARLYRKYFVPVMQNILGSKWQHQEFPSMGMTVFNWRPAKQDSSSINEIGAPGELDVSEKLQQYFADRGYDIAGEGRDQMVFHRPGQRHVLKVIGLGDDLARRDNVADYVRFFAMNQNNPHFPRVSPPREIRVGDEIYTIYRQELLQSLPGEEEVMDWMEKFGAALSDPARAQAWLRENPPPPNLPRQQVQGLYTAVRRLQQFYGDDLGGSIKLDLGHVGNFMQRADGTIVVVDPLAYDESYDTYSESVTESVRAYHGNQGGIDTEQLHAPMWFTASRRDAEQYAGDDGYVVVVDLDITNPYVIQPGQEEPNTVLNRWQELQAQGYDGIYDRRLGDWIPFTREQIRVISKDDMFMGENFADGRVKGKSRPGRVERAGASCKGSVTDLRARARKYGGERGKMYHWCANMKSGRQKNK